MGEKAALASDEMVKDIRRSQADMPTLQIAASLRNGCQVVALAGVDVLTMPPKVTAEYLEMDLDKSHVTAQNWRDLRLDLDPARAVETGELAKLWEIDARFVAFVEDALKQAGVLKAGSDLVECPTFTRWISSTTGPMKTAVLFAKRAKYRIFRSGRGSRWMT